MSMLTPERRAEIERDLDGWESGAYPAGLSPHCLGACCAAARELIRDQLEAEVELADCRAAANLLRHALAAAEALNEQDAGEIARLERENAALRRRLGEMADAAEAGQASPGGNAAV